MALVCPFTVRRCYPSIINHATYRLPTWTWTIVTRLCLRIGATQWRTWETTLHRCNTWSGSILCTISSTRYRAFWPFAPGSPSSVDSFWSYFWGKRKRMIYRYFVIQISMMFWYAVHNDVHIRYITYQLCNNQYPTIHHNRTIIHRHNLSCCRNHLHPVHTCWSCCNLLKYLIMIFDWKMIFCDICYFCSIIRRLISMYTYQIQCGLLKTTTRKIVEKPCRILTVPIMFDVK